MKFKVVLGLLLFLFGVATPALAQTSNAYYIDPSGNNSNSGISISSPWKDFTNLISKTLQPGEKVLLKRGGVWNQELKITGKGNSANFIEIGAYGDGARPKICRNGDISERVATFTNPSYIKINSLEICDAGAGIVLYYTNDHGNSSVYIDDPLAHGFWGIFRGSGGNSGRTDWTSYTASDNVGFSGAVVFGGYDDAGTAESTLLNDLRITNSEFYNNTNNITINFFYGSSPTTGPLAYKGLQKFTNVLIDNTYQHDGHPNLSNNSMRIQSCSNCTIRNTTVDKGTSTAPHGTAAIFLGFDRNVLIDNLTLKNTPLNTNKSDNVGIDFEQWTENVIIQNSRFENNAGPAINFLSGLWPIAHKNAEIKNSTFIGNDWAHKFNSDPRWNHGISSQIMVLNYPTSLHPTNPSNGTIHDNKYQNPENTVFFATKSGPALFTLFNNIDIMISTPTSIPTPTPTPTPTSLLCIDGNLGNINCDPDGKRNQLDVDILSSSWTRTGPPPTPVSGQRSADLNNDNIVDEKDLPIIFKNWRQ